MSNDDLSKDFIIDAIKEEEKEQEYERPFLQLEIPKNYIKEKVYVEEPKRVIIIEL